MALRSPMCVAWLLVLVVGCDDGRAARVRPAPEHAVEITDLTTSHDVVERARTPRRITTLATEHVAAMGDAIATAAFVSRDDARGVTINALRLVRVRDGETREIARGDELRLHACDASACVIQRGDHLERITASGAVSPLWSARARRAAVDGGRACWASVATQDGRASRRDVTLFCAPVSGGRAIAIHQALTDVLDLAIVGEALVWATHDPATEHDGFPDGYVVRGAAIADAPLERWRFLNDRTRGDRPQELAADATGIYVILEGGFDTDRESDRIARLATGQTRWEVLADRIGDARHLLLAGEDLCWLSYEGPTARVVSSLRCVATAGGPTRVLWRARDDVWDVVSVGDELVIAKSDGLFAVSRTEAPTEGDRAPDVLR